MKKISLLLIFGMLATSISLQAQRYLKPQFTSVTVTPKINYANNYTWLSMLSIGHTTKQALTLDLYTPPPSDTVKKRPLVLYLHGGNFLPPNLSGSSSYSTQDSSDVEFCTRLAKLGYVAAAVDYRIGWNPADARFDVREGTIINASYRGVQDVRSAVRFFKANAATYGVDTTQIVVWGESTGAYIALASAVLDSFKKVANTKYPIGKFFFSAALGGGEMAYDSIGGKWVNGDPNGTQFGVAIPQTILTPTGDTLSIPNNPANTSNYQMTVNLGGAIGDLSWIDKNTKPILSFQSPYDLFAPYDDNTLLVPTATGAQPVIRVQGAHLIQRAMDSLGNNNVFAKVNPASDPYAASFKGRSEGYKGLFPILGDTITDSSPWFFWGATTPNAAASQATCPRCTPTRARLYIDTIMGVFAPRACVTLNLSCASAVSAGSRLVQFTVDLDTLKLGPTDSLLIGGDFTSPQWTPTSFRLKQVGTSSLYRITLRVAPVDPTKGDTIQYKFVKNNWVGSCLTCTNEQISGTCGGLGIGNRVAIIPYSADTVTPYVLPTYKYNTCTLSTVATQEVLSQNLVTIAPNPAYSSMRFETQGAEQIKSIDLYDLSGRLIQHNSKVDNFTFDMQRNGLPSGVYIAKITFPAGVLAKKVLFE